MFQNQERSCSKTHAGLQSSRRANIQRSDHTSLQETESGLDLERQEGLRRNASRDIENIELADEKGTNYAAVQAVFAGPIQVGQNGHFLKLWPFYLLL